MVPTGHQTYEVDGNFTIRGVSNPEKLTLAISDKGTGSGQIKGTMVFNRKDYGMNKGIPFMKIATTLMRRNAWRPRGPMADLGIGPKTNRLSCGPLFADPGSRLP